MDDVSEGSLWIFAGKTRNLGLHLQTLVIASLLSFGSISAAQNSANLLINADAEAGLCANDWLAVKTIPGWTTLLGSPTVLCNTIMKFADPLTASSGKAFFAAGPYGVSPRGGGRHGETTQGPPR